MVDATAPEHHCSFCGKNQAKVRKLIAPAGDPPRVFICDACVRVCYSILEMEKTSVDTAKRV